MTVKQDAPLSATFIQRVLFVIVAVALALLAFKLLGLWLLIFGAIIIAVILRGLAEPLIRFLHIKDKFAVILALFGVLALIVTAFYLFGRELVAEVQSLSAQLPVAWQTLQERLHGNPLTQNLQTQVQALGQQAGSVVSQLPAIAGNILSAVAHVLVAVVAGVILAMHPAKYRDGLIKIFPASQRPLLLDSLNTSGEALRKWFIGQFISMVIVGSLTGIGLSILGVPSALALGMISGLAQFVPIVGPVISAGPGLLLAGALGWPSLVWALVIYVSVSQMEANFITPMVQRQITSVPMVLTLFAVVGFAGLLGPMGVLFAMPLNVILYTLVRRYLDLREEQIEEKSTNSGD